jgi:hypothetical protein
MEEPEGQDESLRQMSVEVLIQRLYRDPRYMLIGKTERFGRELISFIENCTLISATGDIRGQTLLNSEYELHGRPDGERPYGKDSLLQHYLDRRGEKLVLSDDDLSALRDESWLYYVRRNFFFLLEEWAAARDDAEHNLGIWDVIERGEANEAAKWASLKWWPWMERDRAVGQALWNLEHDQPDHAAAELYRAQRGIQQFGERYQDRYAQEEGDTREICTHMSQHLGALVELLRRDRDLPVSLDEQLDEAEARGDAEEVERLRNEMIRSTMEEGEP